MGEEEQRNGLLKYLLYFGPHGMIAMLDIKHSRGPNELSHPPETLVKL